MVEASHLTRRFGDRIAVDDLTFAIRPGEIFGLLGPNGAGKTTTLRMLAGVIPPTSGTVRIDGEEPQPRTAGRLRARVGFLTETPGLWDRLTVGVNLLIYARLYELPHPARVVAEALRRFGLWERRDEAAALLSKGMKQKVALARALIHDPPIVLLDEPTAGLDPQTARGFRRLLQELRANGRVILISTHNLDEAERLADRIAVLQQRIVALDTPAALRQRLFGRRVRIRMAGNPGAFAAIARAAGVTDLRITDESLSMAVTDRARQMPRVVKALVEAGAEVYEVVEEHQPLEDVYLRVIGDAATERLTNLTAEDAEHAEGLQAEPLQADASQNDVARPLPPEK